MNADEFLSLQSEIEAWDQKSAEDIRRIYDAYCQNANCISSFIKLLSEKQSSSGASWCLKARLEDGAVLSAAQSKAIAACLLNLSDWQSKLHILQCFQHLKLTVQSKKPCEAFIREALIDKNKFLRAWAYHGFHTLAAAFPEYKDEFSKIVSIAMRDEAPSVKARIRNLKS